MIAVFRKRAGFTLLEVLGAAIVLTIALLGISAAAAGMLKKSRSPNKVETASLLANERISYFRAQRDPFRAAGGTHYPPPSRRGEKDWAQDAAANNLFNCNVTGDDGTNFPRLFVREYLYSGEEGQFKVANGANRTDLGRQRQDRNNANAIPDLPRDITYSRVFPNVDGGGTVDDEPTDFPAEFGGTSGFVLAPRANDDIRVSSGAAIPDNVAFVREVWVQTNHPEFGPSGITQFNLLRAPRVVGYLPPFTVAVTVKTFARIPEVKRFADARPTYHPNSGIQTGTACIGYEPTRPLAEVVGFFGLQRL